MTNLGYLTDILMCFFLGKFISEIHEFSFKFVNGYSASCNPQDLVDSFEIEVIWKLKHIVLSFDLKLFKTN